MNSHVIAVISTYRRPAEIARLLASLENGTSPPQGFVVNDDYPSEESRSVANKCRAPSFYLSRPSDPLNSAASGWNRGLDFAVKKFGDKATHYLIVDDDAVLDADALRLMLKEIERGDAQSAIPAALDEKGHFYPTFMLCDRQFELLKYRCRTREDVEMFYGDALPRTWHFQGLCHLMCRDVVHSGIRFDEDFWLCGEDLDFSMRVAERWKSIFVPQAFAQHLRGTPTNPASARNSEYLKHLSLMQNMNFIGYQRPFGRKLRGRYLDFLRGKGLWHLYSSFFKEFGYNMYTILDVLRVIYLGMIKGEASNRPSGQALRLRRRYHLVARVDPHK